MFQSNLVTVSPKVAMKGGLQVLTESINRANEIKHPVAREKDIEELDNLLSKRTEKSAAVVALQPISQKAQPLSYVLIPVLREIGDFPFKHTNISISPDVPRCSRHISE